MRKIYFPLFQLLIVAFLIIGCNRNPTNPDKEPPQVSILFPPNNAVVGDSVIVRLNIWDDKDISHTELYIDNSRLFPERANEIITDYHIGMSEYELGSCHTIFAKIYDKADKMATSDTIIIINKWHPLFEDEDEVADVDIRRVFARSNSERLEFRIETNGQWHNPYDWSSGINCSIFLDTDQDASSGLTPSDTIWYAVNDIGPDYAVIIGFEGDSVFTWSSASRWQALNMVEALNISEDSDFFEVSIKLTDIDNPDVIDIVVANIDASGSPFYRDWAPDQAEGHVTYTVDKTYIGLPVQPSEVDELSLTRPLRRSDSSKTQIFGSESDIPTWR
ncbi:MAG: hypothetical protein P9X24_19595 [Candidatus Hatepunaea meridiana]|nr:hypothetical protein [Candidatus Hatepunaea meridiana]